MPDQQQRPPLAQLTPSLYGRLAPRRRRVVERQYARLTRAQIFGSAPNELKAVAQRAYTSAALQHVATAHLCGVVGAILVAGYVEDVGSLAHWPLVVLGSVLLTCFVVEAVIGVRQAIEVGAYFRNAYGS
jgi:hypothetical protein